jgi:tRNA pseudouridine38-40 synthase
LRLKNSALILVLFSMSLAYFRITMVVSTSTAAPIAACLLCRAQLGAYGWLTPGAGLSRAGSTMCALREPSTEPGATRKRHMALLFGYEGTGFFGLQSQRAEGTPDQPTVSDVLRQALLRSGAILETNLVPLTRTKWSIASRTDKGVHAARAAVSLKLETVATQLEPVNVEPGRLGDGAGERVQLTADAISTINSYLPAEVRLFGGSNVRKSFDARDAASSRTYEYLLPRAALRGIPIREFDAVLRQFEGSHKVGQPLFSLSSIDSFQSSAWPPHSGSAC